ncbi:MAG: hypothetical protein JST55_14785 [Bacteroidetes bacterium]|nr:hypothetical protein [Bacteroidota bacterium]
MKKIVPLVFIIISAVIFYSCKSDTPVSSNTSGSLTGNWTVDRVQIVSAPTTGTASAMMKAALVPFGEIGASFAGYMDFTFGAETVNQTTNNLPVGFVYDMKFFNNNGYAYDFVRKTVSSTSDGGITWLVHNLPANGNGNAQGISVADANTLYCISDSLGNFIFSVHKSTDMGATWVTTNSHLPIFSYYGSIYFESSISFVNSTTGYIIANDNSSKKIYKTTDSGVNWTPVYNNANYFWQIRFFDEMHGYASSSQSNFVQTLVKTNDGGITWTEYSLPEGAILNGSEFFLSGNTNIGWMSKYTADGSAFGLYKTNNGGQSWTQINNNYFDYFVFKDENNGYAAKRNGMIFKTTNSGADWIPYATSGYLGIMQVKLINSAPVFFSFYSSLIKPSGVIAPDKWYAKGSVTNSAIKMITGAENRESYATGQFALGDTLKILFVAENYSESSTSAGALGKYYFENGNLFIDLPLPNNEEWKIKLRRK